MRKITSIMIVLFVALFAFQGYSHANEMQPSKALTEEQKKVIASLQKEIVAKKKAVIEKYVEYGIISKEKGNEMISHIQAHYDKLEKNGFIHKKGEHHHPKKENKPQL